MKIYISGSFSDVNARREMPPSSWLQNLISSILSRWVTILLLVISLITMIMGACRLLILRGCLRRCVSLCLSIQIVLVVASLQVIIRMLPWLLQSRWLVRRFLSRTHVFAIWWACVSFRATLCWTLVDRSIMVVIVLCLRANQVARVLSAEPVLCLG